MYMILHGYFLFNTLHDMLFKAIYEVDRQNLYDCKRKMLYHPLPLFLILSRRSELTPCAKEEEASLLLSTSSGRIETGRETSCML